jgi:hypothetical protein
LFCTEQGKRFEGGTKLRERFSFPRMIWASLKREGKVGN